jgi:cell division protein FtsQ
VAVPADRRYRRAEAPPVRRRRRNRLLTATRWVLVPAALMLATVLAAQRVLESDMFRVRDITVRGTSRLSTAEVEALLRGVRDENVFLVDFEHYGQRVMASSWVEQVTLSRVLPATLVVDVVERTPIVVARLNQHLYLVDRTGNIVDDYRAGDASYDLPIVDGLFGQGGETRDVVDGERMQVTAAMLDALAARPDLGRRLSQADVTNPQDVLVMIDDDAAWLHLGTDAYVDRLQRYLDVRPALLDRFGSIDYADLKFDGRIYVRGRDSQVRVATAR